LVLEAGESGQAQDGQGESPAAAPSPASAPKAAAPAPAPKPSSPAPASQEARAESPPSPAEAPEAPDPDAPGPAEDPEESHPGPGNVDRSHPVPVEMRGGVAVLKPHASPSVRHFARELGVDLARLTGSGPKQRILREDVLAYVKAVVSKPADAPAEGAGLG